LLYCRYLNSLDRPTLAVNMVRSVLGTQSEPNRLRDRQADKTYSD
jgi:hypothetical protein